MKKTLLMMAAALTAWSASAQLYVTGANVRVGSETNEWDAKNALECAVDGEYYTFEANGEFTISTVKADWDDGWKTGSYTLSGSWNTTTTSATASLQRVDGNIPTPKAGLYVSYKVKNDFSVIEASFSSQAVESNFRLHGQITGNPSWETTEMTLNGDCWEYTGALVAGEFGIKECDPTGGQLSWIGGGATVSAADTEYSFTEGGNSSSTLVGTYTVSYNPTAKTITFKSEGSGPVDPNPVDTPDHLYLVGHVGECEWTPELALELTKEGNVFSISNVELVSSADFSFLTTNDGPSSWNDLRYGAANNGDVLTFVDDVATYTLASNKGDVGALVAVVGTYDMTVTFSESGAVLKVTKIDEAPVVEDLVLTGDFNDWAANDPAYLMTKNGNTYTYTAATLSAGEFKIKTAEESWNTSWDGEGVLGDETALKVDVTPNVAMNAWQGSSLNFNLVEALNNVTITFVKSDNAYEASTLTVAGTSAIEAVEAAATEAPAEYYNLQGIRVLAPEAGQLYIINRAGKVSKEIVR